MMASPEAICKSPAVFPCCRPIVKMNVAMKNPNMGFPGYSSKRSLIVFLHPPYRMGMDSIGKMEFWDGKWRLNYQQRRMVVNASSNWNHSKSPYGTLELERDANEEQIKVAHRRLAKSYHPDVYDGKGTLGKQLQMAS